MSRVTLGEVARERKEVCKKDRKQYPVVGLEHLIPEEITLEAWDENKENTFTKMFHEGDVLFGRRRAYLKKASMAPFDGICSGDITVIVADSNKLLPELLPFIIQNDALFSHAVKNSAGSLSPRVKWEDLKSYEFELPSMERQRELANLLWAMNKTKKAYQNLLIATDELVKSQFIEMFGDPVDNPLGWMTKPLLTMGSCKNGMNFHSNDSGVEINCLGVGDFKDYDVIEGTHVLPTVSLNDMPTEDYLLKDGDIVFVRSNGNKTMVGRSVMVYPGDNPTTFSGFCIRYRHEDNSVLTPYLLRVLKTESVRKQMYGRGANIQNLNQKTLAALNILVPPIEAQREYIAFVQQSDKSKFELEQALSELTATYKSIIAENLG